LSYAEVLDVKVFPVLARGDERSSIPFGLSGVQWVDIRDEESYQDNLSTLAHTVAAFLRDHESLTQAQQAEAAKKEQTGYFYPNKWVRIVLLAVEDVMGRDSAYTLLKGAGLPHLLDHYPPDNMQKEFRFDDLGRLQQTIWEMYDTRGLRGLNLQAGHQAFEDGLTQFRSIVKAAAVAMKAGPLETRMRLGLEFFARFFNEVSDQQIVVSEDDDYWYWTILRCPLCWGWKADEPVCYLAVGVLEAAVDWVSSGQQFDVVETECIAQGHPACVITIAKKNTD
jgi:predicted hydrocarbon binding protein